MRVNVNLIKLITIIFVLLITFIKIKCFNESEINVILIYTSGIYRDGTGNRSFDRFQDNWLIIDNSIYKKESKDLEEFIARMSEIPLGQTVNRNQVIFRGIMNKETEGFLVFTSIESRYRTPSAFHKIPEIIKKETGEKYKVRLKYLYDDL